MADLCEMLMVICFGISWPINIFKLWRTRTAVGTSVLFYSFIWVGYIFGIGAKVIKYQNGIYTPLYVWFFYILNAVMVTFGILIYFRNWRLDKGKAISESGKC